MVAPPGNPPGVLANWTVAPTFVPRDPNNLGVIWPGVVNVTWAPNTITRTIDLVPGQDTAYRFVVICPGIYTVQTQVDGGPVSILIEGSGGTTVLDAGNVTQLNHYYMNLTPGVYWLHIKSDGAQPARVQWTLKPVALDYEKIPGNGVGQTHALSLPLVAPVGSDGFATPSTVIASPSSPSIPAGNSTVFTASSIPTSLLMTLNTNLMGLPSPDAQIVTAVGPTAAGGSIALADNGSGLLPGIRYQSALGPGQEISDLVLLVEPNAVGSGPVAQTETAASGADPEASSTRADAHVLARTDWIVQLAAWVKEGIVPSARDEPVIRAAIDGPLVAAAVDRDESEARLSGPDVTAGSGGRQSVVQADVGAPVSLIVAAAVTYRLRESVLKWWRRHDPAAAGWRQPPRSFPRGPHFGSNRGGTTSPRPHAILTGVRPQSSDRESVGQPPSAVWSLPAEEPDAASASRGGCPHPPRPPMLRRRFGARADSLRFSGPPG